MADDYKTLRDSALDGLKKYMDSLEPDHGTKLAYWIKDYTRFLRQEATFQANKLIRYKRGSIVKVHLGYRIGSEEGGLHYAIVYDTDNAFSSPLVTIIPLTSIKQGFDESKLHRSQVNLGDEIYTKLKDTFDQELSNCEKILSDNKERWEASKAEGGLSKEELSELSALQKQIKYCRRMLDEAMKMKQGSIALVGQITTVSKIRIQNPKFSRDALAKIRVSSDTLTKIDNKVRELFGPKE